MKSCCKISYEEKFNLQRAEEEIKSYFNNGVDHENNPIINCLKDLPLTGKSVLDIGSGVGVLLMELFGKGIQKATYVDISEASARQFKKAIHQTPMEGKVRFVVDDFVTVNQTILSADLVTLDKSICCYLDFQSLVQLSVEKARKWYAYTIPKDDNEGKAIYERKIKEKKTKGDQFTSFLHPTKQIEQLVRYKGFHPIHEQTDNEWLTMIYEKY